MGGLEDKPINVTINGAILIIGIVSVSPAGASIKIPTGDRLAALQPRVHILRIGELNIRLRPFLAPAINIIATIYVSGVVSDTAASHDKGGSGIGVAPVLHTAAPTRSIAGDLAALHGGATAVTQSAAAVGSQIPGNLAAGHDECSIRGNAYAAAVTHRGISGNLAILHNERAEDFHTAVYTGGIAGNLAAGHGKLSVVSNIDAAATAFFIRGIPGNRTAVHRKFTAAINKDAAAEVRSIPRNLAAVHGKATARADEHTAAQAGIAAGNLAVAALAAVLKGQAGAILYPNNADLSITVNGVSVQIKGDLRIGAGDSKLTFPRLMCHILMKGDVAIIIADSDLIGLLID